MLRQLHSLPGLIVGLFALVLASTGAILALDPVLERAGASVPAAGTMTVADLAEMVQVRFPGVERIERRANGAIIVSHVDGMTMAADLFDPVTGAPLGPWQPSAFQRWVKSLHRSFLLDDPGRMAAGISAGAMALMTATGLMMLAAAQGGWGRLGRPVRGRGPGRWHARLGRATLGTLVLSSLTGLFLSLATFGVIDDGEGDGPDFPFDTTAGDPTSVGELPALWTVDLTDLRSLTFPQPGDPTDVFGLQTAQGAGYVDQSTGALINWLPNSGARQVWETVYMLHTGQGLWWFGIFLGVGALGVPALSITGALVWAQRQRARPRIPGNARAGSAETVILIGSEGSTTWAFARTLHQALTAAGQRVHAAPMNRLAPRYPTAQRMFILTATYGDGAAPASAERFLDRLARTETPEFQVAVLGFGDRHFARYCQFAVDVEAALVARGWRMLLPLIKIDRQSAQDFAAWGREVGGTLGLNLALEHKAAIPRLKTLKLVGRQDFGCEVGAPTAILRFGPESEERGWRRSFSSGLPRFEAGDLVGILPPGSDLPRFYSLASSSRDGVLEISVREQPGGLCSGHLHSLKPGDTIQAFIKPNPEYRPQPGRAPVLLIGAGCGIGPLAGFIRDNRDKRPMHLFFGARDPKSDFLYERELRDWLADGSLSRLTTAFSRVNGHDYIQDRIRADAPAVRDAISSGGQVLVCGGAAMAAAVAEEVRRAVAPLGLDVAALRSDGRYLEDVY